MDYKSQVDLAEKYMGLIAKEHNENVGICQLITGYGGVEIKQNKDAEHNCYAAIDGIINYYNKNKDENLIEHINKSFEIFVGVAATNPSIMETLFTVLEYMEKKQKHETVPFKVNSDVILKMLKKQIKRIKKKTGIDYNIFTLNDNFDEWFSEHENRIRSAKH